MREKSDHLSGLPASRIPVSLSLHIDLLRSRRLLPGALGLAAVDGVSVGDEIGKAPAKGDAPGAHLAPGIGPAGRGSAGVL